jgi:hypothetical protein
LFRHDRPGTGTGPESPQERGVPGGKKAPPQAEEIGGANPEQLSYIKGMWELVARNKTEGALGAFIKRIARVDAVRFLGVKEAQKVITALRAMMVKAGYDPDGIPGGKT